LFQTWFLLNMMFSATPKQPNYEHAACTDGCVPIVGVLGCAAGSWRLRSCSYIFCERLSHRTRRWFKSNSNTATTFLPAFSLGIRQWCHLRFWRLSSPTMWPWCATLRQSLL